ncbi:MAG: 4-hydroxythreonine-4-phosphate dehydrogenase PdxA [Deltaproteobacteria bacterium]|nr:4-hydroxythreonine-4-phosphate dehydrogenase PdxA [Deltaproteobacteria bacterium]
MATTKKPTIGVTVGDPKGIGPEIVAKLLEDEQVRACCELRIFGDEEVVAAAGKGAAAGWKPTSLSDADAGRWSAQWVANAVKAALAGEIAAIVTGPINKHRWQLARIHFPGHTEYLAHLVGQTPTSIGPLFVTSSWKVALVTGHLPIKNVHRVLTRERIVGVATLAHETLRQMFDIPRPRLACLGLNPHAGEQGLIGLEEQEILIPAMAVLHDRGIAIDGPFSADTFFSAAPVFDGVLAMYHDQGLLPLKTAAFRETVQLTMGLPFIRTSVDHGTAEDIAWQGRADHTNLVNAIELAVQLVQRERS